MPEIGNVYRIRPNIQTIIMNKDNEEEECFESSSNEMTVGNQIEKFRSQYIIAISGGRETDIFLETDSAKELKNKIKNLILIK